MKHSVALHLRILVAALVVGIAVVIAAPSAPADETPEGLDPDTVVAAVDGQIILWREVLGAVGPAQPGQTTQERRALVEGQITSLIQRVLLKKAAARIGVRVDPRRIDQRIQKEKELAESRGMTLGDFLSERGVTLPQFRQMLVDQGTIQGYLAAILGLGGPRDPRNPMARPLEDSFIRPEAVQRYYRENAARWRQPAQARVRTLYVKAIDFLDGPGETMESARLEARARAREVREEVLAGGDFATLAKEITGKTATPELKTENQLPPAYRKWAFEGEVGVVSDLIELRGGWLLVKIEERLPARLRPFEEVQEEIKDDLHGQRQERNEARAMLRLIDEAEITPSSYKLLLRRVQQYRLTQR